MPFQKIGSIFKIANSQVISTLDQWSDFKKSAGLETAVIDIPVEKEAKTDKTSNFEIVAEVDPEKFIYIHTTIMAGVTPEENGYWITPETEKYINDNDDAWAVEDLKSDYPSFRRAITFVEHDQNLEKAKGKCIDAIARKLPDTILIDVLFSVDKRHEDLVNNILANIINAVSMGCSTEKTVCTICGNEAKDSKDYCDHVKPGNKGRMFKCADGKLRKAAELCKGNTFFDVSLVANPAFAGAVFRKILSSSQLSNQLLANILTSKIENFTTGNTFLKAASADMEMTIKNNGDLEVKTADTNVKDNLSVNDLENIRNIISSTMQQEKQSSSILQKIIKSFFGKTALHPIENDSNQKDFSITTDNFDTIENIENQQQQQTICEKEDFISSKVSKIICPNCSHSEQTWKFKAASIDNGISKCSKCNFIIESKIVEAFVSYADKSRLTELGFDWRAIQKLTKDQIENIIMFDLTKDEFIADPNVAIRKSNVTVKKVAFGKSFKVSKDIPVSKENDTYIYDEDGDALISKDETLEFVSSNNDFEIYKTEINEKVYFPIKKN
jgi:hypothetical protein